MSDTDTKELIERLRMQSANPWAKNWGLCLEAAATITRLEAERDAARRIIYAEREMHAARVDHAVKMLTRVHSLLYPPPSALPDGRVVVFRPQSPDPQEVLQELSDRIRSIPGELEKMPALDYESAAIRAAAQGKP